MEQERYYLRVGLFVSACILACIFLLSWFATNSHKQVYTTYAIYFSGSIDGLSVGSPVRLKGITVGSVKEISFTKDAQDLIFVLADIMEGAPIRKDTVATTQVLGITGTSYISLNNSGTDPTPNVKKEDSRYPVIASKPSSLEKVFASIPDLIDDFTKLSKRGELLLSDENIAAVNQTVTSVGKSAQALEKAVSGQGPKSMDNAVLQLNETLLEAKDTLREIKMLARTLREDPSVVLYGTKTGKKLP